MQISFASDEAKEEFNKIKETEKNVDREKLFYKSGKNKYNFKRSKRIRTFGEDIYNGEIAFEVMRIKQIYWIRFIILLVVRNHKILIKKKKKKLLKKTC